MKSKSFSEKCYSILKKVPKGKITTYKFLAETLKCKAYRAVGNAMNKNPCPGTRGTRKSQIPCHRVVKSNGEVGGFAQGTKKKISMLKKEGIEIKNGKIQNMEKFLYKF